MLDTDHILAVLWRRRLSVVLTFLLTLAAIAAVTFSLPKVYSATAYLWIVPSDQPGSDFEATQVSQTLTTTYAELLRTPGVADAAAQELSFTTTGLALRDTVEVAPVPESQLLEITSEDGIPERAQEVANTYAEVASGRDAALRGAGPVDSRVSVAEQAAVPVVPSRPQPVLYMAVGVLVALLAAAGVGLLRHRLDQRLDLDPDTSDVLGAPVLGRIPKGSKALLKEFVEAGSHSSPQGSGVDDAFRLVLANLVFANDSVRPRTVAVVSAGGGEGKSTNCLGIGRAASENGLDVLLVDGDMRRATLSRTLGIAPTAHAGFSGFLVDPKPLADTTSPVARHRLEVVPAGPQPPNSSALLSSPRLRELDTLVRTAYDLVIYDTPPLSVGADASLIASLAEGVVLIVDFQSTKRSAAVQALDQLARAQTKLLGVIVNRAGRPVDYYYGDASDGRAAATNDKGPELPRFESVREVPTENR